MRDEWHLGGSPEKRRAIASYVRTRVNLLQQCLLAGTAWTLGLHERVEAPAVAEDAFKSDLDIKV